MYALTYTLTCTLIHRYNYIHTHRYMYTIYMLSVVLVAQSVNGWEACLHSELVSLRPYHPLMTSFGKISCKHSWCWNLNSSLNKLIIVNGNDYDKLQDIIPCYSPSLFPPKEFLICVYDSEILICPDISWCHKS